MKYGKFVQYVILIYASLAQMNVKMFHAKK